MTITAANGASLNTGASTGATPRATGVVRKMEGVLWYNMLSEMSQNGLDTSALGAGGSAYQSMFLWDLAQNDFDKYDTGLVSATLRQIGGRAVMAPPPAVTGLPAAEPGPTAASTAGAAGGAVTDAVLIAHATNLARAIWPAVQMAASVLSVPPVAVLAQAALETGWGNSVPGNNVFGIKASTGQPASPRSTHEMVDGAMIPETANFRDYGSPLDCVTDYIRLIRSNFQNAVGQNSVAGFAEALQSGGFATDGHYASKIITISQSPMMQQMLQAVGVSDTPSD
jgi:flagellar protein FlgJ